MTDKQFFQDMIKMVKDTHWIKGTLQRVLEYKYDNEGMCHIDPKTGKYEAGKMGHCLMGLVGVIGNVELYGDEEGPAFETRLKDYPQAARITERLYETLPGGYGYLKNTNTTIDYKAVQIERFNDAGGTYREDIIELLTAAMEKRPMRERVTN